MPKRIVDLRDRAPLLDIASYGRRGPGHRPLSKAEIEHISRTVRRVPEVMIKVSGGARTGPALRAVDRPTRLFGKPYAVEDDLLLRHILLREVIGNFR
jgi:hypothetical protein